MKDFFNLLTKSIGVLIIGVIILIIGASSKISVDKIIIEVQNMYGQILLVSLGTVLILFYLWKQIFLGRKNKFSAKSILKEFKSFEWQWAGQNWIGKVDLNEIADDRFDVIVNVKKLFLGGHDKSVSLKYGPVVLKNINGSHGVINVKEDKLILKDLFVERKVFDMCPVNGGLEMESINPIETLQNKIEGELKMYPSFAGKIKYINTNDNSSHEGDIIIVPYTSHINP